MARMARLFRGGSIWVEGGGVMEEGMTVSRSRSSSSSSLNSVLKD
jgi:hypothetical protein